jgi:cytochrome c
MTRNIHSVFAIAAASLASSALATGAAPADPLAARGKILYESRCEGCHSIQTNRIGPKHLGVVGRKAGSIKDFDYTPALKRAKFVWTEKQLNKWLQGPSKLVPGTAMAFNVSQPADRAAIIAWLKVAK